MGQHDSVCCLDFIGMEPPGGLPKNVFYSCGLHPEGKGALDFDFIMAGVFSAKIEDEKICELKS